MTNWFYINWILPALSNLTGTVLGGIVLAIVFFLSREKLVPIPDITGRWYIETVTEETAYTPFKGMILKYVAFLEREGHNIYGTVEKISEEAAGVKRELVGAARTRGEIKGYIEKTYFSLSDRVSIHVIEHGLKRDSTSFYDLFINRKAEKMNGTFFSTAADSEGQCIWKRDQD